MEENLAENFVPEVKLEAINLPSQGKAYPKDTYFTYRTYLFGEIQKLSISKNMGYDEILKIALSGIKSNIDVYDLTIPDAMYISIARKISTLGSNDVQIPYKCRNEKCGELNDIVFSQADIQFNEMEAPELPIIADIDGKSLEFDCLRVRDMFELKSEKFKRDYPAISEKDKVSVVAKAIRNLPFSKVYEIVSKLNKPEDIEVIDLIDSYLAHSIKNLKHNCKKCGTEISIPLEGREILLRPFRTGENTYKNKIHFGKKPVNRPVQLEQNGF